MSSSLNDDLEGAGQSLDKLQAAAQAVVRDMGKAGREAESVHKALVAAGGDMVKFSESLVEATKTSMVFGRNMGSLGRITDELHKGTEDWVKALSGSNSQVAQIGQGFKNLATQAAKYQKDLEAHEDAVRNTRSLLKSYTESTSAIGKGFKAVRDAEAKIMRDLSEHVVLTKEIEESQKGIQDGTKRLASLEKTLTDLGEARSMATGEEADALDKKLATLVGEKDILAQNLKAQQESLANKQKEAVIGAETASNALRELDYQKERLDVQNELNDLVESYKDSWGGAHAIAGKTLKELFAGNNGLKNVFSMDPKQLRGLREKFKQVGEQASAGMFGSGKGIRGMIGKGVGAGVGAASKVGAGVAGFAANIAGMFPVAAIVSSVVKALWDMANEMDAFYKKYANSASELVSPILDGGDFKPMVKAFGNMTVGATSLNQELGMTGDEMVSMYKNIISSGSSLQRTLGQVNPFQSLEDFESDMAANHKRVATGMRHGSAVLGMSIDDASKSTGEMLNQLRSPLSGIQDQYDMIANSAKRAGLQGAYFMRVIEQSVLSLANYGNFTDVASSALEKFSKSGTTSQKTAEDATQDVMNTFSDASKNYSLLGLYAGANGGQKALDGLLDKVLDAKKKELAGWTPDRIKGDNAGYTKLSSEVSRMQGIKNIGHDGNRYSAMAENGSVFTSEVGTVLREIISGKKGLGAASEDGMILDNLATLRGYGIPEALLQQLASSQSQMNSGLIGVNSEMQSNSALQRFMDSGDIQNLVNNKTEASISEVYDRIDKLSAGEDTKANLRNLLAAPDTFLKMMQQAKSVDAKGNVTWGIKAKDIATDYAYSAMNSENRVRNGKVEDQRKKVDEITELSKRLQINKDKVSWMVSSSSPMQSIIGLLVKIQEIAAAILDKITWGKDSSKHDAAMGNIEGTDDLSVAASNLALYGDKAKAASDAFAVAEAAVSEREAKLGAIEKVNYWGSGGINAPQDLKDLKARERSLKEAKEQAIAEAWAARKAYDKLKAAPPSSAEGAPQFAKGGYAFAGTRKHGDRLLARINSGEWVVPGETMSNIAKGVEQQAALAQMSGRLLSTSPRLLSSGLSSAMAAPGVPSGSTEININVQGVSADEVLRVFKREFSKTQWKGMMNGKPIKEAVSA